MRCCDFACIGSACDDVISFYVVESICKQVLKLIYISTLPFAVLSGWLGGEAGKYLHPRILPADRYIDKSMLVCHTPWPSCNNMDYFVFFLFFPLSGIFFYFYMHRFFFNIVFLEDWVWYFNDPLRGSVSGWILFYFTFDMHTSMLVRLQVVCEWARMAGGTALFLPAISNYDLKLYTIQNTNAK